MATDTKTTGRDSDKFMLRFPDGMRDRIADAAKANNRTMNAEIVARLEVSFIPSARNADAWTEVARIEAEHAAASNLYGGISAQLEHARKALENSLAANAPEHVLNQRRSVIDAILSLEKPAMDQWLVLGQLLREAKKRAMGIDETGDPHEVVMRRVIGETQYQEMEQVRRETDAKYPPPGRESGRKELAKRVREREAADASSSGTVDDSEVLRRKLRRETEEYVAARRAEHRADSARQSLDASPSKSRPIKRKKVAT